MNRLKILREEKHLLQSDIAKYLGITTSAYGFYENEKRDMSPETIIRLAVFFDVTTDYLLGKSDTRNAEPIKEEEIDVAFYDGFKGLNDTNKDIIKGIMEGLKAKQDKENKDGK